MGLIYTEILLKNPKRSDLNPVSLNALADTGALHLCIPSHVQLQLKLEEIEKLEVTLANGDKKLIPYVGPIQISFENRNCFTGALVLGDEPLLGAVPMEDMDLVLSPAKQVVMVNPDAPNIATSVAKGIRV